VSGGLDSPRGIAGRPPGAGSGSVPLNMPGDSPGDMPGTAPLGAPLVSVENLRVRFGRASAPDVSGVSFDIAHGECLAIVGQSGSGKSVTARSLIGLSGGIVHADRLQFDGNDVRNASQRSWRQVRGRDIGFVSQGALVSLDPLRTIGHEVGDALRLHTSMGERERHARVLELLDSVGMPDPELRATQRPDELSGGLRQRAIIASAIALQPRLLIADEPTTALDSTIAAGILDLLDRLRADGTAVLLISHDLATVARLADRVAVMHEGEIVEMGDATDVVGRPRHPYTRALIAAVPAGVPRHRPLTAAPARAAAVPAAPDAPTVGNSGVVAPDAAFGGPSGTLEEASPEFPTVAETQHPERAAAGAPRIGNSGVVDSGTVKSASKPTWPDATPEFPTVGDNEGPARNPVATTSVGNSGIVAPDAAFGGPTGTLEGATPEFPTGAGAERGMGAGHGAGEGAGTSGGGRPARGLAVAARGLAKRFGPTLAVDGVSFTLERGTTLGIVGESGSGKTTVARMVLALETPDAGTIDLLNEPWSSTPERDRRARRPRIGAIYQDALSSFDPRLTVGQILADAQTGGRSRRANVGELLASVGLDANIAARRPRLLSGGQQQRVAIARAIAPRPDVLVCDEPVSSLDVLAQARVLDLLDELQDTLGLSYVFISHDLGVVRHMSDTVLVMKNGQVVESGNTEAVFTTPSSEYTRALIAAAPALPRVAPD
jgi:peptide/nickel transport system ATP-binding protein